ncbi:MAG: SDR family NAD(P)-dependent oxidoreductase [Gemmatimonadales bacterium]
MRRLARIAVGSAALSLAAVAVMANPARAQGASDQRAVLVTGASSGIGRKITELLAAKGHYVYAGARKQQDIDELSAIPNVEGIRLDVTVDAEVAAAVAKVKAGGRGLHGLVNNAGVAIIAPLIEVDEKDLDFIFGVNVLGPWRVTKAFAPLLIESKGRVTTVSSISGILAGPLFGPYAMSKHAIEAYGDALAAELQPFGVRVSLIEPGNYRSDMSKNVLARVGDVDAEVQDSRYERQLRGFYEMIQGDDPSPEPDAVAEAALHALFDPNPKMRYMVVPAARQAEVTIRQAMIELVQLNQGQEFSYDREALVKLLDEALARVR